MSRSSFGPKRTFRFPLLVRRLKDEIDQELAGHLEAAVDDLVAEGWSPAAARQEAHRRFGSVELVRREVFRIDRAYEGRLRLVGLAAEFFQDVAFALRRLGKSPVFAVIATLMLALGIGGSTLGFTLLDQIVLRPLPFPAAERMVRLGAQVQGDRRSVSPGNFLEWRRQATSFSHLAAFHDRAFNLRGDGAPKRIFGLAASGDYFGVFGLAAERGRTFGHAEAASGQEHVAVLSHRLWQNGFGADPQIVGKTLRLDEVPYLVLGVMPAALDYEPDTPDLWVPLAWTPEEAGNFGFSYLRLLGRLQPGVPVERAQQEMKAIAARLAAAHPEENADTGSYVLPFSAALLASAKTGALAFQGAVLAVLFIACANLANLQLARAVSRQREMALRAALGAGRGRIVRQLWTESLVLAGLGTAAGLAFAGFTARWLARSGFDVPRLAELRLDTPALVASLVLTLASTLLFGLLPALRVSRTNLRGPLAEQSAGTGRLAVRDRMQRFLVGAEVVLSLVLLTGAGLVVRRAIELQRVPLGFEIDGTLTGQVALPEALYGSDEQVAGALERMLEAIDQQPGVAAVGLTTILPLSNYNSSSGVNLEGRPNVPRGHLEGNVRVVSPGYFEALGLPLRLGRNLATTDRPGRPAVVVVNETFARRAWPGENPLGKRFNTGGDPMEVVGVVSDMRSESLTRPINPELYLPFTQSPNRDVIFVVHGEPRLRDDPAALSDGLRRAVAAVDPRLPLFRLEPLTERFASRLGEARAALFLFGSLGGIALVLALVGIYGVISHFVAQRSAEIALRLALGATERKVLVQMIGQTLTPVIAGLAVGAPLAFALSRGLRAGVVGIDANEPWTVATVVLLLGGTALLAGLNPARKAIRTSSAQALREV